MPKIDTETLDSVVVKWINFRKEWQSKKTQPEPGDVKLFVDTMTSLSREFVSAFGTHSADYYEAVSEIAGHACVDIKNAGLMT